MKKLFIKFLFLILMTDISNAEIVKLNCIFTDYKQEMNITLDFKKSLWIDQFNVERHMEFNDNTIKTSYPNTNGKNKDLITHFLYSLSRISGNGSLKGFKVNDEQLESVKVLIVDEMIKQNVFETEDKSLDWARVVIVTEQMNKFLSNVAEQIGSDLVFNCKKAKKKF